MSAETLLSAARRLLRFVRIDNEQSGGLISNQTTWAADVLAQQIESEEQRLKKEQDTRNDK